MKKIYFVRHGESELNANNIWAGQKETNLTDDGKKQATITGQKLKNKRISIDLIICSPLQRTIDTASIIADIIGYPTDKIEINPLFIERTFGILEGKPVGNFFDTHSLQELDSISGAESIKDLQIRANKALRYLENIKHDNILIVGHGTFGRALRRAVNKHPHTHEYTQPVERFKNGEFAKLL